MIDQNTIIYLVTVNVVCFLIFWLLKKNIDRIQTRRVDELDDVEVFDPFKSKGKKKVSEKSLKKRARKELLGRFSIIRRILFLLLFIVWFIAMIAPFLGSFSKTFVSLLVTIASVLLGIAARPFIENIIAGVVITFSRQLNTGDTVLIDDNYGTVEDVNLTHTTVKVWDWRRYIVPNSLMLRKEFINYSLEDDDQWIYVEFAVDYHSDIARVKEIAVNVIKKNRFYSSKEEPSFWIMDLRQEYVLCWIAAWTKFYDAWTMRSQVRTELIKEMLKEGIRTHSYNFRTGADDFSKKKL